MRRRARDPRALAGGRHARPGTDHGSRLAPPSRRSGSPWPSISAPAGSRSGTNALRHERPPPRRRRDARSSSDASLSPGPGRTPPSGRKHEPATSEGGASPDACFLGEQERRARSSSRPPRVGLRRVLPRGSERAASALLGFDQGVGAYAQGSTRSCIRRRPAALLSAQSGCANRNARRPDSDRLQVFGEAAAGAFRSPHGFPRGSSMGGRMIVAQLGRKLATNP